MLLLHTLKKMPAERPPIWLMRQAGRYLPEYRALRRQAADFLQFCYTPELATEATLQPVHRYGFDAAILFSDILVVPDALGCGVRFEDGAGPKLEPLRDVAAIEQMAPVWRERFSHGGRAGLPFYLAESAPGFHGTNRNSLLLYNTRQITGNPCSATTSLASANSDAVAGRLSAS